MEGNTKKVISVAIVGLLIAFMSSIALTPLFNTSYWTTTYNITGDAVGSTGVPAWVSIVLGIIFVVALITILLNLTKNKK